MHEAISFLLRETASKVIEAAVGRMFAPREVGAAQSLQPSTDPVDAANALVNLLLMAIRDRDLPLLRMVCHPDWREHPSTAALLTETLNAAPPVSWHIRSCHVPDDWSEGTEVPWIVADLAVTFDLGDGQYSTIPAVVRGVRPAGRLMVDHLEWGTPEPDPYELHAGPIGPGDFLWPDTDPVDEEIRTHAVLECARCSQGLRVPADRGRLRVHCPKCHNAQWFEP